MEFGYCCTQTNQRASNQTCMADLIVTTARHRKPFLDIWQPLMENTVVTDLTQEQAAVPALMSLKQGLIWQGRDSASTPLGRRRLFAAGQRKHISQNY